MIQFTAQGKERESMATQEKVILETEELEWKEGASLLKLPQGVKIKILSQDKPSGRMDMLVSFPPGYVEPRHVHEGYHSTILLEGTWIVEGKVLRPGGYVFGPANVEHGPFECPKGCLVFASFYGRPEHHY